MRFDQFTNKLVYTIPIYSEIGILQTSNFKSILLDSHSSCLVVEYTPLDKKKAYILDAETPEQESPYAPGELQRLR